MNGNMCSCLAVDRAEQLLRLVGYLFVAPSAIVRSLHVDASSFTNEQFPSDFRYQFHTEDRVYYKTELAFTLDEVNPLSTNSLHTEIWRYPCQHY